MAAPEDTESLPRRFIVTGANGLVGSALTRALRDWGEVLAVDRHWGARSRIGEPRATLDLAHPLPDAPELRDVIVVHAAGSVDNADRQALWDSNVTATFNVADWALRHAVRHLVLVSTGEVYAPQRGVRLTESSPLAPDAFAAHTRLIAEETVRAFHDAYRLPVSVARLFFPCGDPGAPDRFAALLDAARRGHAHTAPSRLDSRVSPVHAEDAARALAALALQPRGFEIYNVCGDEAPTLLEIAADAGLGHLPQPPESGLPCDRVGDNSKVKQLTGWTPRTFRSTVPEASPG
jgi:nucleoside-diphosphate-sugar epimerase